MYPKQPCNDFQVYFLAFAEGLLLKMIGFDHQFLAYARGCRGILQVLEVTLRDYLFRCTLSAMLTTACWQFRGSVGRSLTREANLRLS